MSEANGNDRADLERRRVIERPNGYYWQDPATGEESGPFATVAEAQADLDYNAESAFEPGENLGEAEDEIGIADWVDPDTGQPAEEYIPRLEDH